MAAYFDLVSIFESTEDLVQAMLDSKLPSSWLRRVHGQLYGNIDAPKTTSMDSFPSTVLGLQGWWSRRASDEDRRIEKVWEHKWNA